MMQHLQPSEVKSALSDFIDGKSVKRSCLSLLQNEENITELIKKILIEKDYIEKSLSKISLEIGFRLPAFFFDQPQKQLYFGWIIWEKFHYLSYRKIWISELREKNGDWTLFFEEKDQQAFWINEKQRIEMEMDHVISR